jgi:ABC-type glycerol-3-phosphate transport system substrate-binding protein
VNLKFLTCILAAGFSFSSAAFAAGSNESANLRLMAFGSEAQLKAVNNAVARFNQKYPNVKVEVAIDPISNGWGDYVTRVLSQFNANNAYDVYGTALTSKITGLRQFMLSQPRALEEAALMDGAGYFKIFYRISLPQLRPALSALGIITFTQTWNYYFQARVLLEPQWPNLS